MSEKNTPGKHLTDELAQKLRRDIIQGDDFSAKSRSTQFQKGTSGNPKGRPKKLDNQFGHDTIDNSVLRERDRIFPVKERGQYKQITGGQLWAQCLTAAIADKKVYAIRLFASLLKHAEQEERKNALEIAEFWRNYIQEYEKERIAAEASGLTAPTRLPLPEDVVIKGYEVTFDGATCELTANIFAEVAQVRDAFIQQSALDQRSVLAVPADAQPLSAVLAILINDRLPKRYQLSDFDITWRQAKLGAIPKRRLTKQVFRDWKAVGSEYKRGQLMPFVTKQMVADALSRI